MSICSNENVIFPVLYNLFYITNRNVHRLGVFTLQQKTLFHYQIGIVF